ncbi:MAG: Txe/YoeB family addiction module toxin [Firmicutes bacterium]|nr:Txe/YoeB family addiction module toxin [Bacillota bacterium]
MIKAFHNQAWEDYLYWQSKNRRIFERLNVLLKSISRNDTQTIGKVENLKHNLAGCKSCRIDKKNRLIFKYANYDNEDYVIIFSCKNHYDDK